MESSHAILKHNPQLDTFSIVRLVPPEAELPFRQDVVPMGVLLQPKALPRMLVHELVRSPRDAMTVLELDIGEVSLDQVKALIEVCPKLSKLALMLDAPFVKLVCPLSP